MTLKNPLGQYAPLYGEIPPGSTMLELGSQKMGTYKEWFESLGIRHTSIDLNGRGGALELDLQEDLRDELGQFDIVTNIGTSEHVERQEPLWRNIAWWPKVGGRLISSTPRPSGADWINHGRWYPTKVWYLEFCDMNGFEVIDIYEQGSSSHYLISLSAVKREDVVFWMPRTPIFKMPGQAKMGRYE